MDNKQFIEKLRYVDGKNTVYMWGTFGAPVTNTLIDRKAAQYPSWYTSTKRTQLRALVGKGYYGFDCIGLIKGILWGWDGSVSTSSGGAVYASNGMPDTSANGYIALCKEVSTNFSNIEEGEAVWLPGHIGVYIGNGEVIEATPAWQNGVQKTLLSARKWEKHGKMPQLTYVAEVVAPIAIKVTTDALNMRTGPGTGYSVILTIPKGADVQVISNANGWAKISYQGKVGYSSEQYLTDKVVIQGGKVIASVLNVRSGPSTSYRIIGQFVNGFVAEILEKVGDWYKVRYGTTSGYVAAAYIQLTSETPTAVPTTLKGKVVNCSVLNIRQTPGGTAIGSYAAGTIVPILEKVGDWYRTDKGYVYSSYISII